MFNREDDKWFYIRDAFGAFIFIVMYSIFISIII